MHHPKSDVNRLYLPRKEGDRGLVQLELSLKTSIIGMETYLNNTSHWMPKLVKKHEHLNNADHWMLKLVKKYEQNKRMYSIASDAKIFFE